MTAKDPADGDRKRARGPGRPRDSGRDEAILAATLAILQSRGYRPDHRGRRGRRRRRPTDDLPPMALEAGLAVAALVHSSRLAVPLLDTGSFVTT